MREYHEAITPVIKLDVSNSKEIQLQMNSINYAGAKPDAKSGCSDSMFE
jgi:hypothetical protein